MFSIFCVVVLIFGVYKYVVYCDPLSCGPGSLLHLIKLAGDDSITTVDQGVTLHLLEKSFPALIGKLHDLDPMLQ